MHLKKFKQDLCLKLKNLVSLFVYIYRRYECTPLTTSYKYIFFLIFKFLLNYLQKINTTYYYTEDLATTKISNFFI